MEMNVTVTGMAGDPRGQAVTGTDFRGGGWPKFSVSFGKAIPVERTKPVKEAVDALSQRIMREIGMLMAQKESE